MKKDNVFFNEKEFEKLQYTGTISHKDEIVKLQQSAESKEFLQNLIGIDSKIMIYTHNGRFHGDEVFATALILLARNTLYNHFAIDGEQDNYISNTQIIESVRRVPNIDSVDLSSNNCVVLDIRDGHYDHHHTQQAERKYFPSEKEMICGKEPSVCATFGVLWLDLGFIFNLEDVEFPNKNVFEKMLPWIFPMDQQDNYGPNYCASPISKIISNMNGYSDFENIYGLNSEEIGIDFRFVEAVKMAYIILRNEILSVQRLVQSVKDVTKCKFRKLDGVFDFDNTSSNGFAVEIEKVPDGKNAPNVMIDALNEAVYHDEFGNKIHPLMMINHNPDQRDGCLRVVLGRYATLKVSEILSNNDMKDKIKFIHPNGGFLCTFEDEEKLEYFLRFIHPFMTVDWKEVHVN